MEVWGSLGGGRSRGGGRVLRGPLRGLDRGAASLAGGFEVEEARRWREESLGEEGRNWDLNAMEVALYGAQEACWKRAVVRRPRRVNVVISLGDERLEVLLEKSIVQEKERRG